MGGGSGVVVGAVGSSRSAPSSVALSPRTKVARSVLLILLTTAGLSVVATLSERPERDLEAIKRRVNKRFAKK